MTAFEWLIVGVSIAGGFVGSISGFGIGSLITPVLAASAGTKVAVAIVSVPHFIGTAIRFWTLRHALDRPVLMTFGIASGLGGLAGALIYTAADNRLLGALLGALLVFAGLSGLLEWSRRWRFTRSTAIVTGAASGVFGGMVGNQGGLRSAAMLGFDLRPREFIATATAVALMVDIGRLPVYLASEWTVLESSARWMTLCLIGVIVGTFAGLAALSSIPEERFRKVVAAIILALGIYMLIANLRG